MQGKIYKLIDPRTYALRYIGQTTRPLKERLGKHISDSKKRNNRVHIWIRSLLKIDVKPLIVEIITAPIKSLDRLEIFYIKEYRDKGYDLTNQSDGGQEHRVVSEETRKKISLTLTGRKHSPEVIEKRRISVIKTWSSKALRRKQRQHALRLIALGKIGQKGNCLGQKRKPRTDIEKENVSKGLKIYFKNPVNKLKHLTQWGCKLFFVFKIQHSKNSNRWHKNGYVVKGDFIGEFLNVSEFARNNNLTAPNIRQCLNGKRRSCGGYIFEYKTSEARHG